MDRKTAILAGAAVALVTGPAFAAPIGAEATPAPVAASYAELLQPIPNAVERLRAADAQADLRPARLIEAQYVNHHHHHHHHHHSHHSRRWYSQNGYSWYGGAWVVRPRNHHHHHHHHSHY